MSFPTLSIPGLHNPGVASAASPRPPRFGAETFGISRDSRLSRDPARAGTAPAPQRGTSVQRARPERHRSRDCAASAPRPERHRSRDRAASAPRPERHRSRDCAASAPRPERHRSRDCAASAPRPERHRSRDCAASAPRPERHRSRDCAASAPRPERHRSRDCAASAPRPDRHRSRDCAASAPRPDRHRSRDCAASAPRPERHRSRDCAASARPLKQHRSPGRTTSARPSPAGGSGSASLAEPEKGTPLPDHVLKWEGEKGFFVAMLDPLENNLFDLPDYENTEDETFPPLPPPGSPGRDDAEWAQANGDPDGNQQSQTKDSAVTTQKAVKRPRPRLDAQRLISERGIPALRNMFDNVKFKGKGHEAEDLKTLIQHMEHWAHRLFPQLRFEDFIDRVESLGNKKEVQTCLKRIRLDLPILHEDFKHNEGMLSAVCSVLQCLTLFISLPTDLK
nr:TIMELESS-interacting protein isoform X2 [Taeniopygia guttata]